MITVITGLTGSGKTFFGARLLLQEWKRGAKIYTNTPLIFGDNTNVENYNVLDELYNITNGVIYIDEAQKLLEARRWASLPIMFAEKLAQHRKHFLDIITTTQNFNHIDIRLRDLIHERYDTKSVIRIPRNERVYPLFQWIRVYKRVRQTTENDITKWSTTGTKNLFISKFWTKKIYETYKDIGMNRFYTWTKRKKDIWITRIVSRELIQSGKRRIR